MSVDLLAISVGNTNTRWGVFIEDKLQTPGCASNTDATALFDALKQAYQLIKNQDSPVVMVASTNMPLSDAVIEQVKTYALRLVRAEQDIPVPIGRQLDREAIVGQDRLLNAAGAYETLKQACVIVDAGTAITVDYVDAQGTFHGGAIAPGSQLMLESLSQGTAHLPMPEIPLEKPDEVLGHNTAQAISCGVFHGLRGLVRELTEHYAQIAGTYPVVIATGGDAKLLFEGYDLVEHIVPELTLLGMRLTLVGPRETQDDKEAS